MMTPLLHHTVVNYSATAYLPNFTASDTTVGATSVTKVVPSLVYPMFVGCICQVRAIVGTSSNPYMTLTICNSYTTTVRRQSKTSIQSTNIDKKLLETEFSVAICRPTGDKWQSQTLFLSIFGQCPSIVKSVFDCRLSGVNTCRLKYSNSWDCVE